MNDSKISIEEVTHLAHLVKIKLSTEEIVKFQGQFNSILKYIDQLNEVETEGVQAFEWIYPQHNALRADEIHPSLPRSEVLLNSKNKNEKYFVVPTVVAK